MNLAAFALRNRYVVYALSIAAVIFGVLAYRTLPIQLFPDTAPPLVNVLTPYPGAAAQDVADLVSDPIEKETAALEGVYKVTSTSQDGLSLVAIEFRYDVSVDLAAVDVQNAISRIRGKLPREIGEPQVIKFSTSSRPVLTVGLLGDNLVEVRRLAEDVLAPELQRVPGVAIVDVFGGYQPEISVQVDRNRLEAHRLRLGAVVDAIRSHNISAPAGQIRSKNRQYTFRVDEQSQNLQDIADIPITTPAGYRIRVGDVATVTDGGGEDLSRFRVNGKAAIAMQIFKQDDANTVEVVRLAREKFAELLQRYPRIEIIEAEESASFTERVVSNMFGSVWQALFLATLIIFLFLGSLRRGIVVAISMPMSFLLTFAGMKLFNIEVNMVTLTAIILSVGMVVDGAVVILENITRRYHEENLTPDKAAMAGATEIQFAVVAGVATTLIVLIPLLFLYGFVGKTFGPLAATLIIAFVASLLVALGLVPILTTLVTREGGKMERLAQKISQPWNRMMDKLRSLYVGVAAQIPLAPSIGYYHRNDFIHCRTHYIAFSRDGASSQNGWRCQLHNDRNPSGSSLDETEKVMQEVEAILMQEPEIVLLSNQMGFEPGMHSFAGGGVQGPTQGYIAITLTPRTEREETIWQIQGRLRKKLAKIPNIENFVVRESGSTAKATTASSIIVAIKGEDPLVLDRLGEEVLQMMKTVDGVVNPYRRWRMDQRNTVITINKNRARELGISPVMAARELAQSLDGVTAGIFRGRLGEDTPIRVRYAPEFRQQEGDAFRVRTISLHDGSVVPLSAIARGREVHLQGLVTRENLQPKLEILALHEGRPLNFVTADLEKNPAADNHPERL
ncbi:MAG: efflux RND transporter permease subunit [candidate division KSB1 bacterium]|nr:efflux RND transporter permease subunit [candidate division KSB1 bacterium]